MSTDRKCNMCYRPLSPEHYIARNKIGTGATCMACRCKSTISRDEKQGGPPMTKERRVQGYFEKVGKDVKKHYASAPNIAAIETVMGEERDHVLRGFGIDTTTSAPPQPPAANTPYVSGPANPITTAPQQPPPTNTPHVSGPPGPSVQPKAKKAKKAEKSNEDDGGDQDPPDNSKTLGPKRPEDPEADDDEDDDDDDQDAHGSIRTLRSKKKRRVEEEPESDEVASGSPKQGDDAQTRKSKSKSRTPSPKAKAPLKINIRRRSTAPSPAPEPSSSKSKGKQRATDTADREVTPPRRSLRSIGLELAAANPDLRQGSRPKRRQPAHGSNPTTADEPEEAKAEEVKKGKKKPGKKEEKKKKEEPKRVYTALELEVAEVLEGMSMKWMNKEDHDDSTGGGKGKKNPKGQRRA